MAQVLVLVVVFVGSAILAVSSAAVNSDTVIFFPLNETSISGTLKDGYCSDLTTGSVQGAANGVSTEQGPDGTTALSFASDNWVNLGNFNNTCISNPALCPNGLSMVFWLRLNASESGERHIIVTGKKDSSRGLQVFYTSGSHTNILICDGTNRYPIDIDFPAEWTHVTAVYNPAGSTAADKFFVYINGAKKETARYAVKCAYSDSDTNLLLGHDSTSGSTNSRPFSIGQLGFYYKALSQAEVQAQYDSAAAGTQLNCPTPTTTSAPITAGPSVPVTTSSSGSGSNSGQSDNDTTGKTRTPTVLILLSVSLFILLVIVVILIIACCFIVPSAKAKGYKCL